MSRKSGSLVRMTTDTHLTFSAALTMLKDGKRMRRMGWNGRGMWIAYAPGWDSVHIRDIHGGVGPHHPLLFMKNAAGQVIPWVASQTDLLTDDWVLVSRAAARDRPLAP